MTLVMGADGARAAQLRSLGETLIRKARLRMESVRDSGPTDAQDGAHAAIEQQLAIVRAWASNLDRGRYQVVETPDGVSVQVTPPDDVAQALQHELEDGQRLQEDMRLFLRYHVRPTSGSAETLGLSELAADLDAARNCSKTRHLSTFMIVGTRQPWSQRPRSKLTSYGTQSSHMIWLSSPPMLCFESERARRGRGSSTPRCRISSRVPIAAQRVHFRCCFFLPPSHCVQPSTPPTGGRPLIVPLVLVSTSPEPSLVKCGSTWHADWIIFGGHRARRAGSAITSRPAIRH